MAPDTKRPVLSRRIDNSMVKAIARAFRWREMLEDGIEGTIAEIAAAGKINKCFVRRLLRLTLLAQDIFEAILDGRQPAEMTLAALIKPFAVGRDAQKSRLMLNSSPSLIGIPRSFPQYALIGHAALVNIAKAILRFRISPAFGDSVQGFHRVKTHSHWGVSWISSNSIDP